MADKAALLAEAYKRGLLPPDRKAMYEEALARGVVSPAPSAGGETDGEASAASLKLKNNPLRKADAFVRGAADFISMGSADEAEAGLEAIPTLVTKGWDAAKGKYNENLAIQSRRDALDKRDVPVSRKIGQGAGLGGALATGAVLGAGAAVPRLAPSATGVLRGIETVARNAVAGGAAGGFSGAMNAGPGVANRLQSALPGMAAGAAVGAAAPAVGRVAIGAGRKVYRGLQSAIGRGVDATERGVEALSRQMGDGLDGSRLRSRFTELRDNGAADVTLVDALDEGGAGVVRAASSRNTPAREKVQRFAEGRASDLPGRLSAQSRRTISADPRTPDEIVEAVVKARDKTANSQFGAVRGDMVDLSPETVTALRNDYGRNAIAEAAKRERDPTVRAALNRLVGDSLDNPGGTQITVGMADRISRTLAGQAEKAGRAGDNDLASILGGLSRDIRGPTRTAVAGYDEALKNFEAGSKMAEAVRIGEQFMDANTDEFVAAVAKLSPEERLVARAAARRAVERKSGEGQGSAPGIAQRLSTGREQGMRSEALLGQEDARRLSSGMQAERDMNTRAQYIAPNGGAPTQTRLQDAAQQAGENVQIVQAAASGNPVAIGAAILNRLRSAGMSNADAQRLAEMAIDPARTERAISLIEAKLGPARSRAIVEALRTASARNAGEKTAAPGLELDVGTGTFVPPGG